MGHRNQAKWIMVILLMLFPSVSWGGQFMLGAKTWYAAWDSAVLDWFEKDIGVGFAANGLTLHSDIDTGSGYLAGPLVGYQSNDGLFSLSIAAMMFSDFSQDWSGQAGGMRLTTQIDTERTDIDLAVSMALSAFADKGAFLKYAKIYLGYKYQIVDYDLRLYYDTFLMPSQQYDYRLNAKVHMPTIGLGLAYPVSAKLALGLQAGIGIALIDLDLAYPAGGQFSISPSASLTYNGEATLSYMATEHLIVQLGLRSRIWYLKARSPQRWEETESRDLTYGLTASVVYAF